MEIAAHVRERRPRILALWQESRAEPGQEEEIFGRISGGMEALISVFADFLESPEGVDTFSRGGDTRTLVGRIAQDQYDLGRDAVGVIEDFSALRRSVWRSVEEDVNLSGMPGAEVARFFVKLMRASDWVTETGLEAFGTTSRREMEQALGRAEATDLVTGLPDRERFDRLLLPEAVERGEPFSVVVFDVANFTETVAGGNVGRARDILHRLAETVGELAPENAVRARFGDDEVCALLPGENSEGAYRTAERILDQLATGPEGFEVHAGVGEYPAHGADAGELMAETLRALGTAKRLGGRAIVVAR